MITLCGMKKVIFVFVAYVSLMTCLSLQLMAAKTLRHGHEVFPYVPSAANDSIDSLGMQICNHPQIQEKIYLHADNRSYYLGDTLWYKAYVMCADDLRPTDLSRILYVELLTPDGYLVERQQLPIGGDGTACGQFALRDTLYSGYYEVRAYTRWQLNFNVEHREYSSVNRHVFYSKQFERDYFREYPGLYSRVFPVYERPDSAGDYADRRIVPRPKQSLYSEKLRLHADFYPEGGTLTEGLACNVAFEVKDQDGQAVSVEGVVNDSVRIRSDRSGRGEFTIVPTGRTVKASFNWAGKDYTFRLPESVKSGCAVRYDVRTGRLRYETRGVSVRAYSISCRGRVSHFERVSDSASAHEIDISGKSLPTGVNEVILYDGRAVPVASRQLFVNNHDMGVELLTEIRKAESDSMVTAAVDVRPYEALRVRVRDVNAGQSRLSRFSISVRDTRSDEPTYDDGNILTDLLLSGDLKGFVPYPSYYFASDDNEHRSALDLLLKVQGWRRYKRAEEMRYMPEKRLTYEGVVLKTADNDVPLSAMAPEEISSYIDRMQKKGRNVKEADVEIETSLAEETWSGDEMSDRDDDDYLRTEDNMESREITGITRKKSLQRQRGKEFMVEAELVKGDKIADITLKPNEKGHFSFAMPDYYDNAILFVNACQRKDSLRESIHSRENRYFGIADEQTYFVKRDWFYPNYVNKYSWYQVNTPQEYDDMSENSYDIASDSVAASHLLGDVYVRKFRKSRRAINPNLPAVKIDAYKLLNDVIDQGLAPGSYDFRFPVAAATCLFGYLDMPITAKVRGIVSGYEYFHNYASTVTLTGVSAAKNSGRMMSVKEWTDSIQLKHIMNFKLFTDYDKRAGTRLNIGATRDDVTMMIENIPEKGVRYVYSCRRYVMPGYTWAEEFYSPDYSHASPSAPTDYRRTLYWNPNASMDEDGGFTTTIYAGSRPCRVKADVCGMGADGQVYLNK